MRHACWIVGAAFSLALLVGACGAKPKPKTGPPASAPASKPTGPDPSTVGKVVLVQCGPPQAEVIVDGENKGTVEQLVASGGVTLPRGRHRVEIRLAGHRTFRYEFILGAVERLERVQLEPLRSR